MSTLIPVDYTSKDYDGFRQSMLDYAEVAYPEWTGRSKADFGVMLVELFAYMGDILSYYGDRISREAFITTATQRSSLLAHAGLLGYTPYGFVGATGTVTFTSDTTQPTSVVIPAGTQVATDYIAAYDGAVIFETTAAVTVPASGGSVIANVVQGVTQGSTSKILLAGATGQSNILVDQIGTSDASMDQTYRLPSSPVIDGSVRVFMDDAAAVNPAAILELVSVSSLLSAGPADQVFSVSVDETGATSVTLGDGVNGAVPSSGLRIWTTYRTGGGVKGNLDVGLIKNFVNAVVGVSVTTSTVTTGGTDAESNDSIRANAPRAFRNQDRAVTLQDYADVALGVSSVMLAKAVGSMNYITTFVVAAGGATPSSTLLASVQAALDAKSMVGVTNTAQPGTKIFVNVGTDTLPVKVGVYRHFVTADIQAAAESAIASLFVPGAVSLGMRVSVSQVYAAISAIPGVAYVVVPMMARSTDPQTSANDILCRDWEFPTIGTLRVSAEAAQD